MTTRRLQAALGPIEAVFLIALPPAQP